MHWKRSARTLPWIAASGQVALPSASPPTPPTPFTHTHTHTLPSPQPRTAVIDELIVQVVLPHVALAATLLLAARGCVCARRPALLLPLTPAPTAATTAASSSFPSLCRVPII